MSGIVRKLEVVTNVVVVITCFGIAFWMFAVGRPSSKAPRVPPSIKVGERLNIPSSVQEKSDRMIVLFLSTQCHFCTESAPFYQQLTKVASSKRAKVIAVFPEPVVQSQEYFSSKNIQVDKVLNSSLASFNVGATPTVVMADRQGAVLGVWVGKLSAEQQTDVLSKL